MQRTKWGEAEKILSISRSRFCLKWALTVSSFFGFPPFDLPDFLFDIALYIDLWLDKKENWLDYSERGKERGGEKREKVREIETHLFLSVFLLRWLLPWLSALMNRVLTNLMEDDLTVSIRVSGRESLFFSRNPSATYFTCRHAVNDNSYFNIPLNVSQFTPCSYLALTYPLMSTKGMIVFVLIVQFLSMRSKNYYQYLRLQRSVWCWRWVHCPCAVDNWRDC